MDNATPLAKMKKPISKFFLLANLLLLFIAAIIGAYYLTIYKPTTTKPKAGLTGVQCPGTEITCAIEADCGSFTTDSNCIISKGDFKFSGQRCECPNATCTGTATCDQNCTTDNAASKICFSDKQCGTETLNTYLPIPESHCWWTKCFNQTCAGTIPAISPTPTGISIIAPSNTPTPTKIPIPTSADLVPTSTPILTPTPTRNPTATMTPAPTTPPGQPTNTPGFSASDTSGPTATLIPTTPPGQPTNTAAPTATPTEIILAKTTTVPTTTQLLQTGVLKSFLYWVPAIILLVGLIL